MRYPNTPSDMVKDVHLFVTLAQSNLLVFPGELPPKHVVELCKKLIDEEVNKELFPALDKLIEGKYSMEIMAQVLDAYIDTIYVALWGCIVLNLPVNAAWNEVQRANMNKFPTHKNCTGSNCEFNSIDSLKATRTYCSYGRLVTIDSSGKVQKPEGWKEPKIWDVLYRTWTIHKLMNDENIVREKNIQTLEN